MPTLKIDFINEFLGWVKMILWLSQNHQLFSKNSWRAENFLITDLLNFLEDKLHRMKTSMNHFENWYLHFFIRRIDFDGTFTSILEEISLTIEMTNSERFWLWLLLQFIVRILEETSQTIEMTNSALIREIYMDLLDFC